MKSTVYHRPSIVRSACLLAVALALPLLAQTPTAPARNQPAATRPTGPIVRSGVVPTNRPMALNRTNLAGPKPVVLADRFKRATVAEFEQLRTRPDAVVVDVRTAEEFAAGHIPKAGLIDIKNQSFLGSVAGLDRSKLYLVNCAVGGRSTRACQSFAALGFTNVVNLEGGFKAWEAAHAGLVSKEPAVALPQSKTPNMRQSGTGTVAPAAQPAPTNQNPVFNAPVIIRQTKNK